MLDVTSNDGIRLFYEDTGHGRPLMLIHGWTFRGRCFQRNVDVLAKLPASSALICAAMAALLRLTTATASHGWPPTCTTCCTHWTCMTLFCWAGWAAHRWCGAT